jgi:hypothetical protein
MDCAAFPNIHNNANQSDFMTELNNYLAGHYLNEAQLVAVAGVPMETLDALIRDRLLPAPSYVVTDAGKLCSFVFGEMAAPGATAGRYFHPSQLAWIARAREALAKHGARGAEAYLQQRFAGDFAAALATLNLTTWRLRDCFDDAGTPIAEGLRARIDSAWKYFLNGTFTLCVANPISEAHIAYKEVLQEKLTQLSENGGRTAFPSPQLPAMRELIDAYAAASMPFSPVEYPLSSRKRLVEDLRAKLRLADA